VAAVYAFAKRCFYRRRHHGGLKVRFRLLHFRPQLESIVHRASEILLAAQIPLGSLHRRMPYVPKAPNLLSELNALADQALQEIRTTSHLLYPPLLDEVGFSSAAQWYVDEFMKRSGIKTSLELSATPRLTKGAQLVFFRVLQEGLTNVIRHSGSTTVDIGLCSDDENAVLSVRDYGRGIPSEKLNSFHETGAGVGVGLGGMKQRVRELGGHLTKDRQQRHRYLCDCYTAIVEG